MVPRTRISICANNRGSAVRPPPPPPPPPAMARPSVSRCSAAAVFLTMAAVASLASASDECVDLVDSFKCSDQKSACYDYLAECTYDGAKGRGVGGGRLCVV